MPRPARPFLDIRIGGLRLTVQRYPRRLPIIVGSLVSAVSAVLALHH